MKKQAWIQDRQTANMARFHWDPKSWNADPMHFVDSDRPLTGAPPLPKTRSYLRREDARKLWKKLQADGWPHCTPQWGEDAEV